MFTIEQIAAAHSKVKSGADFPAYIQDLKKLGVLSYQTFVSDGHTDYYGENNYRTSSPAKYSEMSISERSNKDEFTSGLKEHQQGKSDYLTFVKMSAGTGVEKWVVNITKMTCTYYDKLGNEILLEKVPG